MSQLFSLLNALGALQQVGPLLGILSSTKSKQDQAEEDRFKLLEESNNEWQQLFDENVCSSKFLDELVNVVRQGDNEDTVKFLSSEEVGAVFKDYTSEQFAHVIALLIVENCAPGLQLLFDRYSDKLEFLPCPTEIFRHAVSGIDRKKTDKAFSINTMKILYELYGVRLTSATARVFLSDKLDGYPVWRYMYDTVKERDGTPMQLTSRDADAAIEYGNLEAVRFICVDLATPTTMSNAVTYFLSLSPDCLNYSNTISNVMPLLIEHKVMEFKEVELAKIKEPAKLRRFCKFVLKREDGSVPPFTKNDNSGESKNEAQGTEPKQEISSSSSGAFFISLGGCGSCSGCKDVAKDQDMEKEKEKEKDSASDEDVVMVNSNSIPVATGQEEITS